MILGQEYDIENEGKKLSKETLDKIHHYKTGKLLSCAFQMGALIASPNDLEILKQIGYKIGLAFQIQDDILHLMPKHWVKIQEVTKQIIKKLMLHF